MNQEPAESSEAPKARKPLWRRILKWTIRAVVALTVFLAVGWGIFNYISARALQAEIDLRAAGQPLTFEEWDKTLPRVAEADDAAPFYRAALALRRQSTDERVYDLIDWVRTASTEPAAASDPSAAEVERVLADNALALEMVDRGSALPQCAYDFGLTSGIGALLPQLSSSRALGKLLYLRTVWLTRQGQGDRAADSLVSSLRLMRMYDRQPILITHLVKIACTALCVDAATVVLGAGSPSDQDLVRLESALAEADLSRGMDRVWVAERVYVLEIKRNLMRAPGVSTPERPPLPESAPPASVLGRPFLRLMVADLVHMYDQYAQATRKDWPEALDAVRDVSRRRSGVFGLFGESLAPSYEKSFVLMGRTIGQLRSAQVAVSVERYRLARGKLPESLEQLREFAGADLPADPFTGKDLIYKVQADGFLVYSVGDDKADDGGLLQGRDRRDWGLSVRRAP